ncbi:2OG-Fe(II) oxygenase [Streptomyces sp. URMC 123]|uniref:2OG-Fe(II) oxygenase n=1 Tax=Streptomyces sp. URMC 123 TaxID=3423403 RepID=UPI003F1D46C8
MTPLTQPNPLCAHVVDSLGAARLTATPWAHAHVPQTLPAEAAGELARAFDDFDLTPCEETRREKSYRFATASLTGPDRPALTPRWAALVDGLHSDAYRRSVSELTGVPLDGARFSLDLWEYRSGDWLAPHVDKADKLVTQIFYLSEGWREGDGGRLLILGSPDATDVARALPPVLGSSAVLVRSETSWHAVEPPAAHSAPRRSMTATFRR